MATTVTRRLPAPAVAAVRRDNGHQVVVVDPRVNAAALATALEILARYDDLRRANLDSVTGT